LMTVHVRWPAKKQRSFCFWLELLVLLVQAKRTEKEKLISKRRLINILRWRGSDIDPK
jgi:hypothetical protein